MQIAFAIKTDKQPQQQFHKIKTNPTFISNHKPMNIQMFKMNMIIFAMIFDYLNFISLINCFSLFHSFHSFYFILFVLCILLSFYFILYSLYFLLFCRIVFSLLSFLCIFY